LHIVLRVAVIVACALAPGAGRAQSISIDDMRKTCEQYPYACVLGEHVLSLLDPCQTLPAKAEGEAADFTMAVRLRLENGRPMSLRISTAAAEPTPFEKQMADGYRDAIMNCQPYGAVSGNAIFWIETKVEKAP
jgi:hypothetical protein